MQKIYRNNDCDLKILDKKTVAIVGFGNQGRAHALNLKDSGVNVIIGLHEASQSVNKALKAGFEVLSVADATKRADIIMILAPDERQARIYKNDIEPNLDSSKAIAFANGFSIHYGQINPPKNVYVFMIAPKGSGIRVRDEYVKGSGIPSLVAIYQEFTGNCLQIALVYGAGIGSARVAMIETTFEAETQADLFGEQAVLCGRL